MKVKGDSHMSSKTARRKPRPSTEFGDWLFSDSAPLYDYGCEQPLPISREEQVERCWLHRELNIGHEDDIYYSTEELRDFVRWNRAYDEEAVRDDIRWAYERRDEQLQSLRSNWESMQSPVILRELCDVLLRADGDSAERELADAVRAAREHRLSWREVGEAIGTSGEAARQRYSASA